MEYVTVYNLCFPFGRDFTELSLRRLCKSTHNCLPDVICFVDYNIGLLLYSDALEVQNAVVNLDGVSFCGRVIRVNVGLPPFHLKKFMHSFLPTSILYFKSLTFNQFIFIKRLNGVVATEFDATRGCLVKTKDAFIGWVIQKFLLLQEGRESSEPVGIFLRLRGV